MKFFPLLAALATLTMFSAATVQAGEPAAGRNPPSTKTPDRASLWYSPSTGAVGIARGTDLGDVRRTARDAVGADDAREVLWTTSRGFAGIATFLDDRGLVGVVHARGLLTEGELVLALAKAAAAKHAVAPLGFARTWVGWGEDRVTSALPIHLPAGLAQLVDLLPLVGLPRDLARLAEQLPLLDIPGVLRRLEGLLPTVRLPKIRLPFLR